jgi:hypothetical protein
VNAQERKALKRALESKENWKNKAQQRKKQIRLLELRIRDLEKSRGQWKEKCFEERTKQSTESGVKLKRASKRHIRAHRKKN